MLCDGFRNSPTGDGVGPERGGVTTATFRVAASWGSCCIRAAPVGADVCVGSSYGCGGGVVSSRGRKDSVEPLFLIDGVGGLPPLLVSFESSFCRCEMVPLNSSSRVIHSGTDIESVDKASEVRNAAILVGGVNST